MCTLVCLTFAPDQLGRFTLWYSYPSLITENKEEEQEEDIYAGAWCFILDISLPYSFKGDDEDNFFYGVWDLIKFKYLYDILLNERDEEDDLYEDIGGLLLHILVLWSMMRTEMTPLMGV